MGKDGGPILPDQTEADGGLMMNGLIAVKEYLRINGQGPIFLQAVARQNIGDISLLRRVEKNIAIDAAIGQKVYNVAKWRNVIPFCGIHFEKEMIHLPVTNCISNVGK